MVAKEYFIYNIAKVESMALGFGVSFGVVILIISTIITIIIVIIGKV